MSNLEVQEEAIALHIDADELCFDAKWHTSVFPSDEWPPIKRRLRERLHQLTVRADKLREALDGPGSAGKQSTEQSSLPWYRRWWSRRAQQVEPVSSPWLRDLYRRTRILLSTANEYIDPNGMGTRH